MTTPPSPRGVRYRRLDYDDLWRIGEIDRTEQIGTLIVQNGAELEQRTGGDWSARPWFVEGDGDHSVGAQRRACERYLDAGGVGLGAFHGSRLVGIGIVVPHLRASVAQLAYLHVSDGHRGRGIGGRICADLEQVARDGGDTSIVVSATPSQNTVRFYLARGFAPMVEPLRELVELEPDDIHMEKLLRA